MKLVTLASSILASAFVFLGGAAVPSVVAASPNDGVRCPADYTGRFANGALTCARHVIDDVSNTASKECGADAPFTNFLRMARGQRDICFNPQVVDIGSSDNLTDFQNGKVVVRVPVGKQIPGGLRGRPISTIGGFQVVQLNENADFIFYDLSKTLNKVVAVERAKAVVKEKLRLQVQSADLELGATTVRSTPDALGTLDKIESSYDLFTFAK